MAVPSQPYVRCCIMFDFCVAAATQSDTSGVKCKRTSSFAIIILLSSFKNLHLDRNRNSNFKGVVAIHTTCKSDGDLLLYKSPEESFGGGVRHTPKGQKVV